MNEKQEESTRSNITLDDRILGLEKDILPFLKKFAFTIVIYYIALSPETAATVLIEYFKITPTLCLILLHISLPVVLATSIARTITIQWQVWIRKLFAFFILTLLVVPIATVFFLLKLFKKKTWRNKYSAFLSTSLKWLGDKTEDIKKKDNSRKFLRFNIVLVIILGLIFLVGQSYDNPLGHLWNPKYNKRLALVANLHFYCQITGNYNEEECKKWKIERNKYLQNDFIKDEVYWKNIFK